MDNYRHRRSARFVGYVNMVFACLLLFFYIILTVGCIVLLIASIDDEMAAKLEKFSRILYVISQLPLYVLFVLVVSVIQVLLTILELYATRKLIKSTEINTDPAEAHKMAMIWKNASIAILALSCLGLLRPSIFTLFSIFIRCIFLFIVRKYILELKEAGTRVPTVSQPNHMYWQGSCKV